MKIKLLDIFEWNIKILKSKVILFRDFSRWRANGSVIGGHQRPQIRVKVLGKNVVSDRPRHRAEPSAGEERQLNEDGTKEDHCFHECNNDYAAEPEQLRISFIKVIGLAEVCWSVTLAATSIGALQLTQRAVRRLLDYWPLFAILLMLWNLVFIQ